MTAVSRAGRVADAGDVTNRIVHAVQQRYSYPFRFKNALAYAHLLFHVRSVLHDASIHLATDTRKGDACD